MAAQFDFCSSLWTFCNLNGRQRKPVRGQQQQVTGCRDSHIESWEAQAALLMSENCEGGLSLITLALLIWVPALCLFAADGNCSQGEQLFFLNSPAMKWMVVRQTDQEDADSEAQHKQQGLAWIIPGKVRIGEPRYVYVGTYWAMTQCLFYWALSFPLWSLIQSSNWLHWPSASYITGEWWQTSLWWILSEPW